MFAFYTLSCIVYRITYASQALVRAAQCEQAGGQFRKAVALFDQVCNMYHNNRHNYTH
jgi:hypothetical protein